MGGGGRIMGEEEERFECGRKGRELVGVVDRVYGWGVMWWWVCVVDVSVGADKRNLCFTHMI